MSSEKDIRELSHELLNELRLRTKEIEKFNKKSRLPGNIV